MGANSSCLRSRQHYLQMFRSQNSLLSPGKMEIKSIHIRVANPTDAEQIAFVHIDSWRTTYRRILTDNFLDKMNLKERTNYWSKILTNKSESVFVADNGKVIGFAAAGESSNKKCFDCILYAIYILQQYQKNNIGRQLLRATVKYLQTNGHKSMYVWVLQDNNSKTFYERLGGEIIDKKEIEIDGQKHIEIAYGWSEIHKLAMK